MNCPKCSFPMDRTMMEDPYSYPNIVWAYHCLCGFYAETGINLNRIHRPEVEEKALARLPK